jgi:uncharacterized protein
MLPLFPLGTVLFPGMVLPLHVFEERYRQLVRDLLDSPKPRRFGVIAIREGRETGVDAVTSLYDVGCITELREADPQDDGRFELVTVGTKRFRLGELDESRPYLMARIEPIPDAVPSPEVAAVAVRSVQVAFRGYLDALVQQGGATVRIRELPDDPLLLSYVVAAAMIIDLPARQALIEERDVVDRLNVERALLASESAVLRATTTRPAPDLRYSPYSPN